MRKQIFGEVTLLFQRHAHTNEKSRLEINELESFCKNPRERRSEANKYCTRKEKSE